jgi:hypothetical protein
VPFDASIDNQRMVGVADPLDAMIGRCDDVVEDVAGRLASSTPFEVGPQRLDRVEHTQRLDRVEVGT